MTIRTQYPFQTLSVRPRRRRARRSHVVGDVPYDREQRSHVSVGALGIEKPKIPGLIHLTWPFIRRFTEAVFGEDRTAVEAEQRAYETRGDWNRR